jgi:hypothetical protein
MPDGEGYNGGNDEYENDDPNDYNENGLLDVQPNKEPFKGVNPIVIAGQIDFANLRQRRAMGARVFAAIDVKSGLSVFGGDTSSASRELLQANDLVNKDEDRIRLAEIFLYGDGTYAVELKSTNNQNPKLDAQALNLFKQRINAEHHEPTQH